MVKDKYAEQRLLVRFDKDSGGAEWDVVAFGYDEEDILRRVMARRKRRKKKKREEAEAFRLNFRDVVDKYVSSLSRIIMPFLTLFKP